MDALIGTFAILMLMPLVYCLSSWKKKNFYVFF